MKITKRQLRRIIAEEKHRLSEANPDGTISADEGDREEELEGEILRELDNLIQNVRFEAEEIGGGFRAPGIRARIYRQMADMIHRAR